MPSIEIPAGVTLGGLGSYDDGLTDYGRYYWDGTKIAQQYSDRSGCESDATPEVLKAVRQYIHDHALESCYQEYIRDWERMHNTIEKGSQVSFKGETYTVFWEGQDKFKWGAIRLGLKDAAGNTVWAGLSQVESIVPEMPEPDIEDIDQDCWTYADDQLSAYRNVRVEQRYSYAGLYGGATRHYNKYKKNS